MLKLFKSGVLIGDVSGGDVIVVVVLLFEKGGVFVCKVD